MGIKTGRYQHQIRFKGNQSRQPVAAHQFAKYTAGGAGGQVQTDPVLITARHHFRLIRKQRILAHAQQQHPRVVFKNFFDAVTTMHIKINQRNPLQAIGGHGMHCAHRQMVNQAKTARLVAFGMMTGRSHRTKRIPSTAVHHFVHRAYYRTGSQPSGT